MDPAPGAARSAPACHPTTEDTMISWAAIFFVIAIVAAFFGFSGVAHDTANIGKILAIVGIVLAIISFIAHRGRQI